jgi:hypothetical protein
VRSIAVLFVLTCGCTKTKVEYIVATDAGADMESPGDLSSAPSDLSTDRRDMWSAQSDMSSPDLAQQVIDMTPGADMTFVCGSEAGVACCTGIGTPSYCADRGVTSGQRLVCHAGVCAECGGMMQLCCAANQCSGNGVCAGPNSAFYGYCE